MNLWNTAGLNTDDTNMRLRQYNLHWHFTISNFLTGGEKSFTMYDSVSTGDGSKALAGIAELDEDGHISHVSLMKLFFPNLAGLAELAANKLKEKTEVIHKLEIIKVRKYHFSTVHVWGEISMINGLVGVHLS